MLPWLQHVSPFTAWSSNTLFGLFTLTVLALAVNRAVNSMLKQQQSKSSSHRFQVERILRRIDQREYIWSKRSRVLILANPLGGGGKALTIWESIVKPILSKTNIEFVFRKTQRSGHAYAIAAADPLLDTFDGIVIISGDGMVHEVVNGLYHRCHGCSRRLKELSSRVPLLVIPAGTMNGLSMSLGSTSAEHALLNMLRCKEAKHVDAFEVQCNGKRYLDCHIISCCIFADHDVLLERTLRPLGWLRKALAPLFVIARKQSYRAQIFLKCETAAKDGSRIRYGLNDASKLRRQAPPEREHDADADMWRLIDDRFAMCLVSNVKYGATDALLAPGAAPDDGHLYLVIVRDNNLSRLDMAMIFLSFSNGSHVRNSKVEYYRVKEFMFQAHPDERSSGSFSLSGEELHPHGTSMSVSVRPSQFRFVC